MTLIKKMDVLGLLQEHGAVVSGQAGVVALVEPL